MKFKCPWCGFENMEIKGAYRKPIEEETECSECGCHYVLFVESETILLVRGAGEQKRGTGVEA